MSSSAAVVELTDTPWGAFLIDNDFGSLVQAVTKELNENRDPRAMNWCVEFGFRRGHVPVLFLLAHNQLRYGKGRVPTVEDVEFGFLVACILLLRVAQDVQSCKVDMASLNCPETYTHILSFVTHWTLRWSFEVLPLTTAIADRLETWYQERRLTLPLPVWATCFSKWLYYQINWSKADPAHVSAYKRCATVVDTRDGVAAVFLARLRASPSWQDFFKTDITKSD